MSNPPSPKLQLSNGFDLDFTLISKMLRYSVEQAHKGRIPSSEFVAYLDSVPNKVKNLCSLAVSLGLMRPGTLVPTELGKLLASEDPFFDDVGILWLLHFIIAANERHLVWNRIVNQIIPANRTFTLESLRSHFTDLAARYAERSLEIHLYKELDVFLNAYTEQQFNRLQYIRADDGKYVWSYRETIPPLIALCCFLVYRDLYVPSASALNFIQLTSANNSFGRVCMVNEDQVRRIADDLRGLGLVYVESRADLDQIRFTDPFTVIQILQRYLEER